MTLKHKQMKRIILTLLAGLLLMACTKQKNALPEGKVVSLNLNGFAVGDSLELVNKDSVLATVVGTYSVNTLIFVPAGQEAEIIYRKKGTTAVLARQSITATPYQQSNSLFYDNGKIYNKTIKIYLKGYASEGVLDILIDGKVVTSGSAGDFEEFIQIGAEEGKTRELTIKDQETAKLLSTKQISPEQAVQTIKFYYDGKKMVDKIDLIPPTDPNSMNICVKFDSFYPEFFLGHPVDLVFYKYKTADMNSTMEATNIRVSVTGNFSEPFALPALPDDSRYYLKIFKPGTDIVPYDTTKDILPIHNRGFLNITVSPGKSQLWIIRDSKEVRRGGTLKGTIFSNSFFDISGYFQ